MGCSGFRSPRCCCWTGRLVFVVDAEEKAQFCWRVYPSGMVHRQEVSTSLLRYELNLQVYITRSLTSRKEFWTTLKHPSFNWLSAASAAPTNIVKSVSESTLLSVALLAVFKVIAWSSIAIVALALPLFIVIQPCIERTSPKSIYGGRLGTLNDLSILRLLNALDPDLAYFVPKPGQRPGQTSRDLSSTIRPATNTARTRLIVLVALCAGIIFLPGILFLARSLRTLIGFRTHWHRDVCEGEEMVFLPWRKSLRYGAPQMAPTEQDVRKLASDLKLWDDGQGDDAEENDERTKRRTTIRAVFAVP